MGYDWGMTTLIQSCLPVRHFLLGADIASVVEPSTITREEIVEHLRTSWCEVKFYNVAFQERTLICTLSPECIAEEAKYQSSLLRLREAWAKSSLGIRKLEALASDITRWNADNDRIAAIDDRAERHRACYRAWSVGADLLPLGWDAIGWQDKGIVTVAKIHGDRPSGRDLVRASELEFRAIKPTRIRSITAI